MGVITVPIESTTLITTLNKNEYCLFVTTPVNTNDSDTKPLIPGYAKYAKEKMVNVVNSLGICHPLQLIQKNEYRFDCIVPVMKKRAPPIKSWEIICITDCI